MVLALEFRSANPRLSSSSSSRRLSELNRTPFDLPEAESELVAGYHVEYSGFRFAFFMLAEYVYVYRDCGTDDDAVPGGWHAPFPFLDFIPGIIWFLLNFVCVVFFIFWIRATMPRIRVDQLMGFGWKVLLPLSLVNIFITAIVYGDHQALILVERA